MHHPAFCSGDTCPICTMRELWERLCDDLGCDEPLWYGPNGADGHHVPCGVCPRCDPAGQQSTSRANDDEQGG